MQTTHGILPAGGVGRIAQPKFQVRCYFQVLMSVVLASDTSFEQASKTFLTRDNFISILMETGLLEASVHCTGPFLSHGVDHAARQAHSSPLSQVTEGIRDKESIGTVSPFPEYTTKCYILITSLLC